MAKAKKAAKSAKKAKSAKQAMSAITYVRRAAQDDYVRAQLRTAAGRLREVYARISRERGKATEDRKLYDNLREAAIAIRNLVAQLGREPEPEPRHRGRKIVAVAAAGGVGIVILRRRKRAAVEPAIAAGEPNGAGPQEHTGADAPPQAASAPTERSA